MITKTNHSFNPTNCGLYELYDISKLDVVANHFEIAYAQSSNDLFIYMSDSSVEDQEKILEAVKKCRIDIV